MFSVSAESIGTAHLEAVKKITKLGVPDITEDGEHVVKLEEPLCIHISDPLHDYNKFVKSPYGSRFDDEYKRKVAYVTAKNHDGKDPVYTYGNRFRDYLQPIEVEGRSVFGEPVSCFLIGDGDVRYHTKYGFGYDQAEACLKKLRNNPSSRRAIMVTWIPWKDHESSEPPCIVVVDFKVIRKDTLTLVAYIRSNDILMAWGENAIGLTDFQFQMAKKLNMKIGYLETISRDAHIYYKRDQNYLRDMGIMYDL